MLDDDRYTESVTVYSDQLLWATSNSWEVHMPRLPYAILQFLCQSICIGSTLEGLAYPKYGTHRVFLLRIDIACLLFGACAQWRGAVEAGPGNTEVV